MLKGSRTFLYLNLIKVTFIETKQHEQRILYSFNGF